MQITAVLVVRRLRQLKPLSSAASRFAPVRSLSYKRTHERTCLSSTEVKNRPPQKRVQRTLLNGHRKLLSQAESEVNLFINLISNHWIFVNPVFC